MTRVFLITSNLLVCHAQKMKKNVQRRSFFILEKIQIESFLQARSYRLRCLANKSDDELSKRTKVDHT